MMPPIGHVRVTLILSGCGAFGIEVSGLDLEKERMRADGVIVQHGGNPTNEDQTGLHWGIPVPR